MKIDILTLFPEMFEGVFKNSILKRAQDAEAVKLNTVNFRYFSDSKHLKVDDYPYGGGQGMVLKPEPIFNAVKQLEKTSKTRIILMCPQGQTFTQKKAEELAQAEHLIFICGHYEGYDERIRTHLVTDELSLGDFVLTGGELAAMTMIDAIVRLKPSVLGNELSHQDDSFSTGLLEYPQYTRPAAFNGLEVPDVLLSGNHANIDLWRRQQAIKRTFERRPDLLETYPLTDDDKKYLATLKNDIAK